MLNFTFHPFNKNKPRIYTNEPNVTNETVLIRDIRLIRVNSWLFFWLWPKSTPSPLCPLFLFTTFSELMKESFKFLIEPLEIL